MVARAASRISTEKGDGNPAINLRHNVVIHIIKASTQGAFKYVQQSAFELQTSFGEKHH